MPFGIPFVMSLARFESLTAFIISRIRLNDRASVQEDGYSSRLEHGRVVYCVGCSHRTHDAIGTIDDEYA